MANKVLGIHHVTAISGDPRKTVDFYSGVLGLRMVKKTVNFENPDIYHLYFGNEAGDPATLLTFFPWGTRGNEGHVGNGQVSAITLLVPTGSLEFWKQRLIEHNIEVRGPEKRFGDDVLLFSDFDGMPLELIAGPDLANAPAPWTGDGIDEAHAIRCMHSVTLAVEGYERTGGMMTAQLGFEASDQAGNRFRYEVDGGGPGRTVDIVCDPYAPTGRMGVGAIHHIAWRTQDDQSQIDFRETLTSARVQVSSVKDRQYFKSIYMREPGGVNFEIATDGPGFTVDEPLEKLGQALKLPAWFEDDRSRIESQLAPLESTSSAPGRKAP